MIPYVAVLADDGPQLKDEFSSRTLLGFNFDCNSTPPGCITIGRVCWLVGSFIRPENRDAEGDERGGKWGGGIPSVTCGIPLPSRLRARSGGAS